MNYVIFKITREWGNEYFFIRGTTWSSDFDSLEQLVDVGLDDPQKVVNNQLKDYTMEELAEELAQPDIPVKILCKVKNLEDIEKEYPHYFI